MRDYEDFAMKAHHLPSIKTTFESSFRSFNAQCRITVLSYLVAGAVVLSGGEVPTGVGDSLYEWECTRYGIQKILYFPQSADT